MAIAQTATATQARDQDNPATMAFDCNGGNLLVVGICVASDPRADNAPTYNGVNMVDSGEGEVDSGEEVSTELWYLVNPAAGSNTISIPNASGRQIVPIASAWSGVDTGDPLDVSSSDFDINANDTNPSVAVTTSGVDRLIIDAMADGQGVIPVANSHILISSQDNVLWDSSAQYTLLDGSSGISLTWTLQGQDDWAQIVAAFNPSGAPPAGNIASIGGVSYTNVASVFGIAKANIGKIAGVDAQ